MLLNKWIHPATAESEFIVLFKPGLLPTVEGEFNKEDEKPIVCLENFCFYDEKKHFVPLTSGLLQAEEKVYFNGTVKPVMDEDGPSFELKEAQLNEWWIFDFGQESEST